MRRSAAAAAQQLRPKAAPIKRATSNGLQGAVGAKQRKVTASASGAAARKPATFLRHAAERSSALAAARANEKPIFNLEAELRRWPVSTSSRAQINFASDCSGLESFMFAFKMLGLQHRVHAVFCSDTDPRCQQMLRRMHEPQLVYKDVRGRDIKKVPGNVDIYVAGFPCQF